MRNVEKRLPLLLALLLVWASAAPGSVASGAPTPAAPPGPTEAQPPPAAAPPDAPVALPLYRVTVSARRFVPEEATSFSQEILGEEARQLPLIDDDLFRSLHLVPGVEADDYSARFSLRGGERDEVLVLLDGVPVFDPFHLQDYGGALSSVDLGVVERSTLLADGFPARYGDRMGGVLDVRIRDAPRAHEQVVGFDLLNAHAQAAGPLGDDGGYRVSLRRGYIDLFLAAWAEDVDFRPSYWDAFVKVDQALSPRDRVAAYGLWAADSNEIRRDEPKPDLSSDYGNGQAWLRWDRRLGHGARLESAVLYGHATRDRREGSWGHDRRRADFVQAQQDWSLPLGPDGARLRWGGRLGYAQGDYDYANALAYDLGARQATPLAVDTQVTAASLALYLQHDARWLPWLQTSVGLHGDRIQGVEAWHLGPRAALAVLPNPRLTLRAAWGLYYQPLRPEALPVEAGVAALQPGERAEHRVLGLQWRPGPALHLRLEGYLRSYTDLVGYVPDLSKDQRTYTHPSEAEARGLELEARGYLWGGRLGWLLGYSLARSEEWDDGGERRPRANDHLHGITAGLDLDLHAGGHLSLAYRYRSGLPYTPALGVAATADAPPALLYAVANSGRMPEFQSLDLRWSRHWVFTSWALQGYLQLMNATLRPNVEEIVQEAVLQADGTYALERQEEHYFPLLPTLGCEARF